MVAVGPPVARRPPHRSQQAELPHWAPASGDDGQAAIGRHPYPIQLMLQPSPVLCPAAGLLGGIAFGQSTFLHRLRRGLVLQPHFVRRLLRYYWTVRLPVFVHRRLVPLGFTARTQSPYCWAELGVSRLPREKRLHMPWFSDRAGAGRALPKRHARCGLPHTIRRSASRFINPFRGSIARPAGSPVNASSAPLPAPSHDSGPA